MTNELKKRFCKDCNLPINLFEEPYFTERLTLYNPFYHCLNKYRQFEQETSDTSEQNWFEYYNQIKNQVITDIKDSTAYQEFNKEDMNKYKPKHTGYPSGTIYKPGNVGKQLISIDMKQANFQAMRHYNMHIFKMRKTWEEFISDYTASKHIIHSKYIRQVILGALNPKRQTTYSKYLMDMVFNYIEEFTDASNVIFFGTDEIVIDITHMLWEEKDKLIKSLYLMSTRLKIQLKMTVFQLLKFEPIEGYLKKHQDGTAEFKAADSTMLPILIKTYLRQPVTASDCTFYHNHLLAQFQEIPTVTITDKRTD